MFHYDENLSIHLPGFTYEDLFIPERLEALSIRFFEEVKQKDPAVYEEFRVYRETKGAGLTPIEISQRILDLAPHLSAFLARMFGVGGECGNFRQQAADERTIHTFKKEFFVRRALKKVSEEETRRFNIDELDLQAQGFLRILHENEQDDLELSTASAVLHLIDLDRQRKNSSDNVGQNELNKLLDRTRRSDILHRFAPGQLDENSAKSFIVDILTVFERWLVTHYYRKTLAFRGWATFMQPHHLDYSHLVGYETADVQSVPAFVGPPDHYRRREGFDLTDTRFSKREVSSEVDYCIFCHERDKDSCSKGFRQNEGYKSNPLGYSLEGCPLDQKISESQALKNQGDILGALAVIAIDNPLCPGTGHRICNDCMKSCIYQKQDPVNIPQIETGILTDVLNLPWGFEIYSLLTRWNPLNVQRPHPLRYNGKNVLVVGMGPAGYTLAHYLLNEGFGVVGIDGLKIEPLPVELAGDSTRPCKPIKDISTITASLGKRVLLGFGGVSEYGITSRWDKNFLTVIYLNLLRRERFRLYDGVRFGGTLSLEDAWDLGFDHACIATGAGKPTFISMKNNLIRGIRKASDFLMALQLTGAGKMDSMANLQVCLPAVVIGGGLTAIDTATELMAYYPVQVTKIKQRFDVLCEQYGRESVERMLNGEEKDILATFLEHAQAIEQERRRAAAAGERPNFIPLLRRWGGVSVCYRKSMNESPAYRLNHEEIIKAFEEGIYFIEGLSPAEAVVDEHGALKEMVFQKMQNVGGKWKASPASIRIPARTLMVAAGTVPNVMYERERPGTFELDEKDEFYAKYSTISTKTGEVALKKAEESEVGFFTSYQSNGKYVTFYGDNHPDYEGNVVKAMASAKHGFRKIVEVFGDRLNSAGPEGIRRWDAFAGRLDEELRPTVVRVDRLTKTIIEVVVHAPRAARQFKPGQFYRLQNYEIDSPKCENTLLMMEGIALTGASVDKEKGMLSLIVLEMGASSRMCTMLKAGQRVVVMGPTGTPTDIVEGTTALLLGGGLGNAVLFSIAKALKENNNKVVYFAGYKKKEDLFKQEEIEAATDIVTYSVDSGDPIPTRRPQDKTFVGNIIQAMLAYGGGKLGTSPIPLSHATRIIAIGSDRMMAAVAEARHGVLEPLLNPNHRGIASINSPMQCMMKAICAQCVQRHVIPGTDDEVFVFTCYNQDQNMDDVDFSNLSSRLKANSLMEKITNRWFDYILARHDLARV